jgi:outer membrane receptor for ferrienterochelin and colicin
MKIYISLLLLIFILPGAQIYSSTIKGVVKEKSNPGSPIAGANIYWAGTTHGTASNTNGEFELEAPGGNNLPLVVSFVGYKPDTVFVRNTNEPLYIYLEEQAQLNEVIVNERRRGQYHSTLNTIQTTTVTTSELHRAACCNLSESFETNAAVDVSYSDAVTGAKQIQMLGLSGIYVQTISENMPLIRGIAAPYGLGYVPGPWMESIQISKGTSSVVNGYEAITGQINVEYKKPQNPEILHLNLYGNEVLKSEANMNYAHRFNDKLSTMILFHGESLTNQVDHNSDSFIDMPLTRQINLYNRWNIVPDNGGHREFGFKILDEHRQSGQVDAFKNPGAGLYGIDLKTRRYEVSGKNGIMFDKPGTSLGIQASGSYHNQESLYGNKTYNGTQYNGYLNVIYMGNFGSDLHNYKTGASLMADSFDETLNGNNQQFNETTPGIFAEYDYNLHNQLNIMAGIRADYSTMYGLFFTPRAHARWNISENLVWRGSAGKGFRSSHPLSENNYLLASSREIIIDNDLKQEEAINAGTSFTVKIPIGDYEATIMADYYHTRFINQVVRDVDSHPNRVHFTNNRGLSYSNAFQAEIYYEIIRGLIFNAAYRLNDVKQTVNDELRQLPLTSRYRSLLSLSYSTRLDKWQIDLTGQFNGGGRMPDPSPTNPLWSETFDAYNVYNMQITRNFKRWSFYAGAENLLGYAIPNPIVAANDPWGSNFDGSMIWGPIDGRKIYFGLRYTINEFN